MTRVHLDHNATTPLRPEARAELLEALDALGGNPSSVHTAGRAARALLDDARERVAGALGVLEDDVVFTGGGTEANSLALLGALRPAPGAGLVTVSTEHASVLGPAAQLEGEGHQVRRIGVDAQGRVDVEALLEAACDARLVSVALANNEVGALGPVEHVASALAEGPSPTLLHTDAVQALGRVPVDLAGWGVDLATLSAHKVGGPLGVGVLVRRTRAPLAPLAYGGGQEFELRPGTENVPAIVAAARAIELAVAEGPTFAARARGLLQVLWEGIHAAFPAAQVLGPAVQDEDRLPNTLNVSLPGVDGRVLVARLDLAGLEASAGSACASGSLEPSHVLLAMGCDEERARAGLRLSIGRTTDDEDLHAAVEILGRTL